MKKGLLNLASILSEQGVFEEVCKKIIDDAKYVGYIEIIGQVLKRYPNKEIIMMLLYNTDVVQSIKLRDTMRYEIFNGYFCTYTEEKENYEETFIKKQGFELDIIADLCYLLPAPRSEWAEIQIAAYEKQIAEKHDIPGFKLTVEDNNKVTYGSGGRDRKNFAELHFLDERKNVQEVIEKLNQWRSSREIMFDHDDKIMNALVVYFQKNPDQLSEFVQKFITIDKDTKYGMIDNWLLGSISKGQIDAAKEIYGTTTKFYERMIELYTIFLEDVSSKQYIARVLNENEYIRSLETKSLQEKNPQLFKSLKELIINLANDPDPSEEREDGFSVGLNSVRGIGIGLVAVLVFYYPKDENLLQVLSEKSDDAISGIQASVIENLVYLIRENYSFCEEIISKFKEKRTTVTDSAIIHYMFSLGKERLESSQDLLYFLEKNKDEKIQEGLGKLIGQAFCYGVDLGTIVDKMIKKDFGTDKLVNSFSFQLENQIPKILVEEERTWLLERVLTVYKRLFQEYGVDKIDERLSYLYYGNDLRTNHFEILRQYELFETVIQYGSYSAQHHLNEYLLKCLKHDYSHKEYIVGLLLLEVSNEEQSKSLLSYDHESEEITEMLTIMIEKDGRNEQIDKIFDTGLKFGASNFYEMFERFYLY